MPVIRRPWPKNIKVDKRIVKILSESTYENFPAALKEIITNSYDADASEVIIKVDAQKEQISIEDNGRGMSEAEFDFFLTIAGIKREKQGGTTPSGRHIVGKFGVGFLAIFPFFNNYSIESKKNGSDEILTASIPCYKYFSSGKFVEVSEIPIQGHIKIDKSKLNLSFTRITLSGFTSMANAFFHPEKGIQHRRDSIKSLSGIDRIKWRLEEDLPIKFDDEKLNVLTRSYSSNLPFNVLLNGDQLLRRTYGKQILEINSKELSFQRVYGNEKLEINEKDIIQIGKIKFHYFILTNKKAIHPFQARGIKKRNLNIGVGDRTSFGLDSEVKGGRSRLQWLTGEVLIIEGLNDLINVNRTDFYFDPDYEKLIEFVVKRLSHHSNLLESEAEYISEKEETKIRKLQFIEEDHEEMNDEIPKKQAELLFDHGSNSINKHKGKIDDGFEDKIQKVIQLKDKSYKVKVGKWDYKKDFFPACKIKKDSIIINKGYPLFLGVKHTDVFIRMHLLLIINLEEGTINESGFTKINEELLEIYKGYQTK